MEKCCCQCLVKIGTLGQQIKHFMETSMLTVLNRWIIIVMIKNMRLWQYFTSLVLITYIFLQFKIPPYWPIYFTGVVTCMQSIQLPIGGLGKVRTYFKLISSCIWRVENDVGLTRDDITCNQECWCIWNDETRSKNKTNISSSIFINLKANFNPHNRKIHSKSCVFSLSLSREERKSFF